MVVVINFVLNVAHEAKKKFSTNWGPLFVSSLSGVPYRMIQSLMKIRMTSVAVVVLVGIALVNLNSDLSSPLFSYCRFLSLVRIQGFSSRRVPEIILGKTAGKDVHASVCVYVADMIEIVPRNSRRHLTCEASSTAL